MAGQISIRLPDEIIARLNQAARRSKRKRAEILRSVIEHGLDALETDSSPGVEERLEIIHRDLIERITALPELLTAEKIDTLSRSSALATLGGTEIEMPVAADKMDTPLTIELLPADSVADEGATSVGTEEVVVIDPIIEVEAPTTVATDLFQDSDGGLQNNQRTLADVIDIEATLDQRISSRLRRARLHNGWSTSELGAALNMDVDLVEDIESGRSDVPKSRGIRVEAKLQQWEAEMST